MSVYLPSFIEFLSEMLKLWQIENFAVGNFLVGRVGRLKNGWIVTKCYSCMRMHERDMPTKFQLNRPKITKVILCFQFWLVGRLGRSAWTDFHETFIFKGTCMQKITVRSLEWFVSYKLTFDYTLGRQRTVGWKHFTTRHKYFRTRIPVMRLLKTCSVTSANHNDIGLYLHPVSSKVIFLYPKRSCSH